MKYFLIFFGIVSSFILRAEWQEVKSLDLEYQIYIPAEIKMGHKINNAMMINLHGCGQLPIDLQKYGNWDNTAEEYNMIIVLPKVPNDGKIYGCWDYYGMGHSRSNRDNIYLLNLVEKLIKTDELKIDKNQIYISGLSSGGGESLVLACLAPDLFSGVGLNAAPVIGTTANEIQIVPTKMFDYLKLCKEMSGENQKFFNTQLMSIIYGLNDNIVNPSHELMIAELFSQIYQIKQSKIINLSELAGTNLEGSGNIFYDGKGPRISLIQNTNLGHNWPAGNGNAGDNFINFKSVDYPNYLANFFSKNNRRSTFVYRPALQVKEVALTQKTLILNLINNQNIDLEYSLQIENVNLANEVLKISKVAKSGKNNIYINELNLPEGEYKININYNQNNVEKQMVRYKVLGEFINVLPPQLLETQLVSVDNCLTITGFFNLNGTTKIDQVIVDIDREKYQASILTQNKFEFKDCRLSFGEHRIKVYATNLAGKFSNKFNAKIFLGNNLATSNLTEHILNGRIPISESSFWYAKFQDHPFTLLKKEDGQWVLYADE